MAFESDDSGYSFLAASAINAAQPVALVGAVTAGSAADLLVMPAASLNIDVIGIARATVPTYGYPVTVRAETGDIVKAIACASLGAGARVAVGSTNGRLAPVALSNTTASQVKFAVGVAMVNAVDGDLFAVLLKPEQVV